MPPPVLINAAGNRFLREQANADFREEQGEASFARLPFGLGPEQEGRRVFPQSRINWDRALAGSNQCRQPDLNLFSSQRRDQEIGSAQPLCHRQQPRSQHIFQVKRGPLAQVPRASSYRRLPRQRSQGGPGGGRPPGFSFAFSVFAELLLENHRVKNLTPGSRIEV